MSSTKKIAINARILSSPGAGVSRHAREIIRRLSVNHSVLKPNWTGHGIAGHAWEQLVLPASLDRQLLWSPANTGPISISKQVVTIHDTFPIDHPELFARRFSHWYRWLIPRLARKVAHVVTVSEYTKERLVELSGISPDRITVIHNGVGLNFHPREPKQIKKVREKYKIVYPEYLLALSTIEPRKNIKGIIRAWSRACLNVSNDLGLIIAGVQGNPRIFRAVGLGTIPPRVQFVGRIDDEDLPAVLSGAKALVFPSFHEGFGIPAIEAMACGCPVITANTSALPEICGEAALFVCPTDIEEIEAAITQVVSDSHLASELRSRGLRRAKTYSWDKSAAEMSNLLVRVQESCGLNN